LSSATNLTCHDIFISFVQEMDMKRWIPSYFIIIVEQRLSYSTSDTSLQKYFIAKEEAQIGVWYCLYILIQTIEDWSAICYIERANSIL